MPLSAPDLPATPVDLTAIQHYVWTRYVEHGLPEQPLDEAQALMTLEAHHAARGLDADAECFYYGILAFERSFAEPERSTQLLRRALAAFCAYRGQTSHDFVWEAVEDRYEETLERLGVVKRAAH
ncbi:MAG TPA: hypothetical protein DEA08_13610 [Planctomycetes bacterium]|nr:hypothetical protein [Planctomycetota bacterium]